MFIADTPLLTNRVKTKVQHSWRRRSSLDMIPSNLHAPPVLIPWLSRHILHGLSSGCFSVKILDTFLASPITTTYCYISPNQQLNLTSINHLVPRYVTSRIAHLPGLLRSKHLCFMTFTQGNRSRVMPMLLPSKWSTTSSGRELLKTLHRNDEHSSIEINA